MVPCRAAQQCGSTFLNEGQQCDRLLKFSIDIRDEMRPSTFMSGMKHDLRPSCRE